MDHKARPAMITCAAVLFGACVTVNIYFPAPEVRAAAQEIVEETWGGPGSLPGEGDAGPGPGAARDGGSTLFALLGPAVAEAAEEPQIDVSTPRIRELKASMKAHAEALKPYLRKGAVGIANDGMLVERDLKEVSLSELAGLRRTTKAENEVRAQLYAEIAEANNFGKERIPDIREIFAETWIAEAEKGWWVQRPDGSWVRK